MTSHWPSCGSGFTETEGVWPTDKTAMVARGFDAGKILARLVDGGVLTSFLEQVGLWLMAVPEIFRLSAVRTPVKKRSETFM